jgi:hypothetical protein
VKSAEADVSLVAIAKLCMSAREIYPDQLERDSAVPYYRPFYDAAWELCRLGILRPGRIAPRNNSVADSTGDYFSFTEFGRQWLKEQAPQLVFIPSDTTRLSQAFASFAPRFGLGFRQRAAEAVLCHRLGANLAACVMAGAAAESILLAVAITKSADGPGVEQTYSGRSGRMEIVKLIVKNLRPDVETQFKSGSSLITYWRDQAGHGMASTIGEIDAFLALNRLLRFAHFTQDNWGILTS